ncbi:hypothetical protein J5N97_004534 [Dioscorea zingiberensis]|uniref:VQ domain-containing protein n=1 Tax=Dioscorea zingiberensis TaxID=325984 RepID=A0A9D5HRE4_9LILI|nr:hypothetical protein J5N97_004534 [Dioscorea zingiberensis]
MSGKPPKAMKVTIIETQFVQTDAEQFKSVVQRLTGNNISPPSSVVVPKFQGDHVGKMKASEGSAGGREWRNSKTEVAAIVAPNKVKEEDVNGLLMEVPSLEDLSKLLGD